MNYITVQLALRRYIVAQQAVQGAPYRKVCECATQHAADLVCDALMKARMKAL